MSCTREDLKARLTDVLVGEAEPSMREAVFAHAETCPSCRADREQLEAVLGLLKAAPPWKSESASDADGDALSTIQRQKIVAAARPASRTRRHAGPGAMSWLAFAAGLSAVGVALVLARRASVTPVEIETPTPAAVTSSVHETPAAPEGPMLPRVVATPTPPPVAPAAIRERAPMNVAVSKEAMQEFEKPVDSIAPSASLREVAKARREASVDRTVGDVIGGLDPVLAQVSPAMTLPAILQVEGARDPLHVGGSVVRVVVARANAAGVACVEFDASMVAGRPSRLGSATRAGANAASCAGEGFDVQAGQSTAVLLAVTARSGPGNGVIGRVSLRDGSREIAARSIERSEVEGGFAAMPADFRIAYIEARLAEAPTGGRADASRALLPLAEALPDSPVAHDLITRLRSAARP